MMNITNNSFESIVSILTTISLSLIALITAIGNIIVLLAFYYDKKLRTINDYFIMNMAIADFLVGFFCIPFYIPYSINNFWPFGRFFCKIWVTVDDVATMASVINIVAISVNRYWSIAYPISYRKYARQHLVYLVMGVVWCFSFINFVPGIWLINFFDKNAEKRNDCSGDYNRSFVYMLIAQFNYFIWPFIVLCVLNLLIMCNISKRTRKMTRLKSIQISENIQQTSIIITPKLSPKFSKHSSNDNFYQSKIIDDENSLFQNSPNLLSDKRKYSTYSPEPNTKLSSLNQQYSPNLRLNNSNLKQINNSNNRHCRQSFPTLGLSRKSSKMNGRVSRNYRSDSTIQYEIRSDIQVKEKRRHIGRDSRINRDRKAARSLFILVIVFLSFLSPYVICAVASTAGFQIPERLFQISFWLLWINSSCNPFLYPFIQIKYRRAYAKLFYSFFQLFSFKRSI